MSFTTAAVVLAWVAITLLGLALSGLMRQIHLLRAAHGSHGVVPVGLPAGTRAPTVEEIGPWDYPAVLLFVRDGCPSCVRVLPIFNQLAAHHRHLRFAVVSSDGAAIERAASSTLIRDHDGELFSTFQIPAAPYAVGVRDGVITAASPVGSDGMLEEFVTAIERGE